jgi:hypothetical protein
MTGKKRQPRRLGRVEIIFMIGIVIGLIALRLSVSQALQGTGCPSGAAQAERVGGLLHASLPGTVREIESLQTGERAQYCEIYARFKLPAADLNAVLNTTRIRPPLAVAPALREFASIYRRNPWKPEAGVTYQCGRSPQALDYLQAVCVDTRDPAANIVYFTVDYLPE